MAGSNPNWTTNYDPPASEWNLWWSKKQDWSAALDAFTAQGGAPSFTGPNNLQGPLTLSFTGGNALTVSTATPTTATTALGGPLTVTGAASFASTLGVTGAATFAAGSFTTINASGLITPASAIGIAATATNDSAPAGSVGQFVSVTVTSGAAVTLTSGATVNVTSTPLPAGNWLVMGNVGFLPGGAVTSINAGINTVSGTLPAAGLYTGLSAAFTSAANQTIPTTLTRVTLTTATTVYLLAAAAFGSTNSAYGTLQAWRPR